jgi:putative ABC transport system permease protein
MVSAIFKKSWTDLKKRKSRTFFTVLTIALAISGLGLFAVVPLMDQTMLNEVNESNMYDVKVNFNYLELNETNFVDLENIDNIESAEGKSIFLTRFYIGERRNDAVFVGIDDFDEQRVDIVSKDSGSYPNYFEVLSDTGNSRSNLYNGKTGDRVSAYNSTGQVVELSITGKGHTLGFDYTNWGIAVFYTDLETVQELANASGYNYLSIDLEDSSETKAERTIEDIRSYLSENTDFQAFTDLPEIRTDNDWPGKEEFEGMASFFYILAFITMFCSIFLISNTMHTMVSEQRKEIAQMKAIGATRLQITKSYLATSIIIGIIGTIIGIILGVIVAYFMEVFLLSTFYGINPAFSVDWQTMVLSFFTGIAITVLATLPALFFALKITVRQGLEGVSITANGSSQLHRTLLRFDRMPRTAQMGVRNITRKKGRSAATTIQVALAVGMFLSIICVGYSLGIAVEDEFDNFTYDIMTTGQTDSSKPLNEDMGILIENIEGVDQIEPFTVTQVRLGEWEPMGFGYDYNTISYNYEKTEYKGRWFNQFEQESNAKVIVISKALARLESIDVGDRITIQTATGPHEFEVVGLNSGQMNNGMVVFMPISTMQNILHWNDTVTGFTIKTDSGDHSLIDRVSTEIEDVMLVNGYVVNNQIMYVMEEQNQQMINNIFNLMIAVGSLIVLITMIGLMSTLTMNILERTKEIGMMRCLGSRSGHIRSVFGIEGFTLVLIGWLIGIPVGYVIGQYITIVMYDLMHLEMAFIFPLQYILLSLVLASVVTLIIIQPPLWRASHLKPGDALRYE